MRQTPDGRIRFIVDGMLEHVTSAPPQVAGVYVIAESDTGPCKIGFAVDAPARLKFLQAGNPRPLRLVSCVPHVMHRDIERRVHWALANRQIHGEWFDVTAADATAAVLDAERWVAGQG